MIPHFLTILRKRETEPPAFREAARQLASLLAKEIAAIMPLHSHPITTPMGSAAGFQFEKRIILVPILRAGLALLPSFLDLFKDAAIGFFGIRRDPHDARPHLYYENIPEIDPTDITILLDPMLATGGTANLALAKLLEKGASPENTLLATFLASEPGLEEVRSRHPKVRIYPAAVDPNLDSKKFIVPGLGDFGNRYFGT